MASSINAITTGSGGVITTADNSGNLNIQSGGTTVAAVTSSGVAVTGTLTVNGTAVATAGGAGSFTTITTSGTINSITVGLGAGSVSSNTAVGVSALPSNSTGSSNTAVGYSSLYTNSTGTNNTAIGINTLYNNGVGAYNTAVGNGAGVGITSGTHNICLGYNVNLTGTTVHRCVYLGAELTPSSTSASSEIVISGNATTGKGSNTGYINPSSGSMYQGSNSSTWATTSDQRLKKNIIDNNAGLDLITAIQIRNFEYRLPEEITELDSANAIKKEGVQLGVIAQELQQILPECIKQESTGVLSVDTDNLTWYLINAVKELKAEIDLLKGAA